MNRNCRNAQVVAREVLQKEMVLKEELMGLKAETEAGTIGEKPDWLQAVEQVV